jgi:hypothetical protein
VLLAAVTAGAAFAALGLSEIRAVRQLGVLCAAGEVLTAIAIVLVTPEIGAWLERGTPPAPPPARWTRFFASIAGTRARALVTAALVLAPIAAVAVLGPPPLAAAIVGIRPSSLAPLRAAGDLRRVRRPTGAAHRDGRRSWPEARGARRSHRGGVGRRSRRGNRRCPHHARSGARDPAGAVERDALDLPAKADELARALRETGFAPDRFAPVLAAMRAPSHDLLDVADFWARSHAGVTIAEAYRAGYLDGVRAARAAQGPMPSRACKRPCTQSTQGPSSPATAGSRRTSARHSFTTFRALASWRACWS